MARVPKDVSRRQRIPPRRKDLDGPPAADERAVLNGGSGAGGAGKFPGRQPPWEKTQPEPGSFGEWLRRQREMREISLRDIAERTKISLRYLEAMEEDRFDVLPAPIFAKGFLREYARYVGLSPDEVVNHYLSVQDPQEGMEEGMEDTRPGRERARRTRGWTWGLFLLLAGALLLALVAVFAWWAQKRRDDSSMQPPPPIAAPPRAAPAAAMSAPPPEAASAPLEVALDFTENCWVEAVVDGKNRLSELRVQGESLQLEAKERVVLTLGNAGAVEIQVNGYPLDLGKKKGEVVHDLQIDLETVRELREKRGAH
jgi:cytoskeleton protein RodZ